jgi:hypothetical protein
MEAFWVKSCAIGEDPVEPPFNCTLPIVTTKKNYTKAVLGQVNLSGKWATDVRYGGKDMIMQSNQWQG